MSSKRKVKKPSFKKVAPIPVAKGSGAKPKEPSPIKKGFVDMSAKFQSKSISTLNKDFVRGKKEVLSSVEKRQALKEVFTNQTDNEQLFQESDFTSGKGKKMNLNKNKLKEQVKFKKTKLSSELQSNLELEPSKAEYLKSFRYRDVSVGTIFLGTVIKVQQHYLVLSLPNFMVGQCKVKDISANYLTYLEQVELTKLEGGDGSEEVVLQGLKQMFHLNQKVLCYVKEVDPTKPYNKIQLSLDPVLVNGNLTATGLVPGMTVNGTVRNLETYGAQMDLALDGISAFLPFGKALFGKEGLKLGQTVLVYVELVEGRSVQLSEKPVLEVVQRCSALSQLLPGCLVEGKVTHIWKNGLQLNCFGFVDLEVEMFHLPRPQPEVAEAVGLNWEAQFRLQQKVVGRVTLTALTTTSKTLQLSTLTDHTQVTAQFQTDLNHYPFGKLVTPVTVVQNLGKSGLLCTVGGAEGFEVGTWALVPYRSITDHPNSLEGELGATYAPGTVHKARVLGAYVTECLLKLSLQASQISSKRYYFDQLQGGQKVQGKVVQVEEGLGVTVQLSDQVPNAFIPLEHCSDVRLSQLGKLFVVGRVVHCLVWSKLPQRQNVYLTHKKSLLRSLDGKILQRTDAQPNLWTVGVISRITSKGLVVYFYNNLSGFLHQNELEVQMQLSQFQVGDPLRCRVKFSDKFNIYLSLKEELVPKLERNAPVLVQTRNRLALDPLDEDESESELESEETGADELEREETGADELESELESH